MGSRDFGFLTLRNTTAYQPNGLPVPPNSIFVTSTNGAAIFTNNVTISTLNASTLNASTINASSIVTDYLTVNSTTTLSTTTVNNTLSLIGDTPASSQLWLHNYKSRLGTSDPDGGLYLETSTTTSIWFSNLYATAGPYAQIGQNQSQFYGSVDVASTLTASTIKTNLISTNNITTNYISTYKELVFFDNNLSTCTLDNIGSTLYIDGQPVITDAIISTVSSVFWNAGPNGSIYNKNIGNSGNNKLVYIGDNGISGIQPQFTLDVAGSINASTFLSTNVIQMNNGQINGLSTIYGQNIIVSSNQSGYTLTINNTNSPNSDGTTLSLENATNINEFRMVTDTSKFIWYNSGSAPLNPNNVPSTLQLYAFDMTTGGIPIPSMIVDVNGRVGIGSNLLPQFTLDVNGPVRASTFLSTNVIQMNNGVINPESNSLILGGEVYISSFNNNMSNASLNLFNNAVRFTTNNDFIDGFFIEVSSGYNTNFTNIGASITYATIGQDGITCSSIQHVSTLGFASNQGQITGLSTINGLAWPPDDDALWSKNGNDIYNDNSGNVGIGNNTPINTLDINGSLRVGGWLPGNTSSFIINLGSSGVGTYRSAFIASDGINMEISNQQNGKLSLGTNNSDKLTILPSGNVGIGTITPAFTLDVAGSINASTFLSTNVIQMNNGVINPESNLLVLGGEVYISSFNNNMSNASLNLFNNAVRFTTNNNFIDGFFIEVSSGYNTNFTNIGASITYATIGQDGITCSSIQHVSTLGFASNQGQITGLSTINGLAWPPVTSLVGAYVIADYIISKIIVIKSYSDGTTITTNSSFSLNTSYEIYSSNSLSFQNCRYIIVGGGGGGGGASGADIQDTSGGGGGGSGAFVFNPSQSLTGITTIHINVASGGNGGTPSTIGNNGNSSIITLNGGTNIYSGGGYSGSSSIYGVGLASGGTDGNSTLQFAGGNGGIGGGGNHYPGSIGNGTGGGLGGFGAIAPANNGGGGGGGGIGILSVFSYINAFSRGGNGGNASAFVSPPGDNGMNGIYGGGGGGGGAVSSSGGNGGGGIIALYFYNN